MGYIDLNKKFSKEEKCLNHVEQTSIAMRLMKIETMLRFQSACLR